MKETFLQRQIIKQITHTAVTNSSSLGIFLSDMKSEKLENELSSALLKAVKIIFKFEKIHALDAEDLRNKILLSFSRRKSFMYEDIKELISDKLNDIGITGVNVGFLTDQFYESLVIEILNYKDLSEYIKLKKDLIILDMLNSINSNIDEASDNIISSFDKMLTYQRTNPDFKVLKNEIISEILKHDQDKSIPQNFIEFFEKPLFLERTFEDNVRVTLKDVYILPKFKLLDFPKRNEGKIYDDISEFIVDFNNDNICNKKYSNNLDFGSKAIVTLFIKGAPGNGKSSLFYNLAHTKVNNSNFLDGTRLHFVKMIDLLKSNNNYLDDLNPLDAILSFTNCDKSSNGKILFILDGLDEICAVKELDIKKYCENLTSALVNTRNCKSVITTRLNYVDIPYGANKNVVNIELMGFQKDDMEQWIKKYFSIRKDQKSLALNARKNLMYLNEMKNVELNEIFSLPLLFYMITVSGIDISNIENIGQLYDEVFDELLRRDYNESLDNLKQRHGIYQDIPVDLARDITKIIAFTMYKNNELLIPINNDEILQAIEKYEEKGLINSSSKKKIEKLFLLTFFYKEHNDLVEFSHKSIMEFFAAEMIVDNLIKSENISTTFFNLFVDIPISVEVMSFFKYCWNKIKKEIKYKKRASEIEEQLIKFAKLYFNSGAIILPNSECSISYDKIAMYTKVLLVLVNDCFNHVDFEYKNSNQFKFHNNIFSKLINNTLSVKSIYDLPFLENEAAIMSFNEQHFYDLEINRVSYDYSKFIKCEFEQVRFSYASIKNVTLKQIKFKNCKFSLSDFSGTYIENAEISNCIFNLCNLEDLSIKNCNFSDTYFLSSVSKVRKNKVRDTIYSSTFDILSFKSCLAYFDIVDSILKLEISNRIPKYLVETENYQKQINLVKDKSKIDILELYKENILLILNYIADVDVEDCVRNIKIELRYKHFKEPVILKLF